jgi:large subunit ribosomal protein L25
MRMHRSVAKQNNKNNMKSIAMFGYLRDGVGKASSKTLRNEGKVPCVLYGGSEHIHFSMYAQDFKQLVYTPNTYKVKLDLDGKIYRAILKDLQFHPVNDTILHADFQEIDETKEVELSIPIKLVGNSVGVRAGGKLVVKSQKLRVRSLPANLPDVIEINIDALDIGKAIKVAEVQVQNMTLLDSPNNPIVTVKTTRAAMEEAKAAAADSKKK